MPRAALLIVVLLLLTCSTVPLVGCVGMRFSVDLVPTSNDLAETRVSIDSASHKGKDKVALIDVSGLIVNAKPPGLLSRRENPVARFAEALQKAAADDRVRAIIVRINSPGGTVTASDVMYRELVNFKQTTTKPVVILMADVAASGGYYLACAGDHLIAHGTTITGSIGVIMQTVDVSSGLSRIGIKTDAIVSGPNKDLASPLAPMPDEHREILQRIVDEFYGSFRQIVIDARSGIASTDLAWVTDGRVVTGKQAAEIGLVDEVGDLRIAFARAREHAGLSNASLVRYHRPSQHVGSAYAQSPHTTPMTQQQQINLMQLNVDVSALFTDAGFYYLWDPHAWE